MVNILLLLELVMFVLYKFIEMIVMVRIVVNELMKSEKIMSLIRN